MPASEFELLGFHINVWHDFNVENATLIVM